MIKTSLFSRPPEEAFAYPWAGTCEHFCHGKCNGAGDLKSADACHYDGDDQACAADQDVAR